MKVAAILALASSATAQYFSILVSRSASPIHLTEVAASSQRFWIGKNTTSYCPLSSGCPKGDETLFAVNSNSAALAVSVPGGQQIYIDPKSGALGFTQAHSAAKPEGAITTGFKYTPPKDGAAFGYFTWKRGFLACSATGDSDEGPWQIYADLKSIDFDEDACLGFNALAVVGPQSGKQVGAWQYT